MNFKTIAILFLSGILAACSSSPVKDPYSGLKASYIYAKGHGYLQRGYYDNAITAYQSLDSQYPFESYSQLGDLDLIYAYYKDGEPALALAAADRYIMLYPHAKDLAYAHYMKGVIEFEDGRGFLQKYFPYSMAQHSPASYAKSYSEFQLILNKYPNSPYSQDARRRMIFLKNTMAQYELNVANFYFKLKAYVAAANRAKIVLQHYPRTPAVKPALELIIKSYKLLNLPRLAVDYQKVFTTNFPKG